MNPYKLYLDSFFNVINEYDHLSNRTSKVLSLDAQKYSAEGAKYTSWTALALSDWTETNNTGWTTNFYSGISKLTSKDDYTQEINNAISIILSSYCIHCYESFERFLKKMVSINCEINEAFRLKTEVKCGMKNGFAENRIKGDETLLDLIVCLCDPLFTSYSKNNNSNIRFKALYKVLLKTRNSMVHSQNVMLKSTLLSDPINKEHFARLFDSRELDKSRIEIIVTQVVFKAIIKTYAGFAFQIYKILSVNQNFPIGYDTK